MSTRDFILQHPGGLGISALLTEADLNGFNCSRIDMGTGWVWYQLPVYQEEDVIVGIGLGFNSGHLQQISVSDTHEKSGLGWENWSEQQEILRAESIGNWLARKGFPPGSYSWGVVSSGYDPKSGFGAAVVRFAT